MSGNNVELTVKDAARLVAKEIAKPRCAQSEIMGAAERIAIALFVAGIAVAVIVAILWGASVFVSESKREACFRSCELQTIGREFGHPSKFFLVHHCAEHDREHMEPIPERVYFEMRDNGLKEVRR